MGEACLTSHSAPATTATPTHTATLAGTLRPLTLRQRPLPPRMAMATHMLATVLATTVLATVVPTEEPTHTPLTPAMATATHTRVPPHTRVPMPVMLVLTAVPTLVMAMATMDVATATHTTIRLSSDVAHEG